MDERPADAAPGTPTQEAVARPAGLVSLATTCSRVMGLLREAIFAALFAAGPIADAFIFAFRIPNLLRDFFAEGALSSAFVPTLAETRAKRGQAAAFELARRVFGTLGAIAGLIVLVGILFAPVVVAVVAPDGPEAWRPLTIKLTRIMFPFLLLVGFASLAMGVLNTWHRYFLPALAPVGFNVVAVAGGGLLLLLGTPPMDAIVAWAALVVVGGAVQFLMQLPALRKLGVTGPPTIDLAFRDPALRQIARRMGPVVISLAGTNVMLVITTALASQTSGWASSLNYAFRLVHLPIGVIGVALGTVVLSAGARRAAEDDHEGLASVARRGLRLNWFLALPSAVGLFVLAEPLVTVVYQHGRFGSNATALVVQALQAYAVGIVFYSGVKAAAPAFLARGDTRTPMYCSLAGIAVNLIVALLAIGSLGHRALALAVAAGACTNYLLLRGFDRRRYGNGGAPGWAFLTRIAVACALMGAAGWALAGRLVGHDALVSGRVAQALLTVGAVGVLAGLYFLVCARVGVAEVAFLKRRFGRGRRA